MKGSPGGDDLDAVVRGLGTRGSACPTAEGILAFYVGTQTDTDAGPLAEHLARCPSCLELSRDARLFLAAMRDPVSHRSKRFDRTFAALAAGVVLLVGVVWAVRWGLTFKSPLSNGPVARATPSLAPTDPWRDLRIAKADYSPPEPAPDVIWRGEDEEASPADGFAQAMEPYRHDDFAKAEARLVRYSAQAPGDHRARFYLGVSRLLLGRPQEAIPLLRAVMDQDRGPLGKEARWYAALAHLKAGEGALASPLLEVVVATSAEHRASAEALLRTLQASAAK